MNLFFLSGSQIEELGQKILGTEAGSREELLHAEVDEYVSTDDWAGSIC